MAYKIDFDGGTAVEWHLTDDGARPVENADYRPTVYVAAAEPLLDALRRRLREDPKVAALARDRRFLDLGADGREPVLRVDLERVGEADTLAREVAGVHADEHPPGAFRLFNVDLSPQFRYCLETDTSPVPDRRPTLLELTLGERALADRDVTALRVDGEPVGDSPPAVLRSVRDRLRAADPDVLVCSSARLVPLLHDAARAAGVEDFRLGRRPGYDRLAGSTTFESYGQVGHSPARYDVPGRAVVALDNSFLWEEGRLDGLLELVEWSHRPLQETAWASIGTAFTAIQLREATERDVLLPWNKREPEAWKSVDTLHAADRGGFTFAPEVGLHEDVVEIDFSSLYPNIMCEYNVSPETVGCACHDRADVPGLGYSLCEERGFLPDVLRPLIDARDDIKQRIAAADGTERARLEGRSAALKWVLVTCFGYQGYRNAKFGRIECHEAINAVARELLLDAKEALEAAGWRVVHGIVDSLWVTPRDGDPTAPIGAVCERITDEAGIRLEHESDFEWVCFLPLRDADRAGALTKYFGKRRGADGEPAGDGDYKYRGVECRQRSTPAYVADCQRAMVRVLDEHRTPEAVADRCKRYLAELHGGAVDPADLVVSKRASKPPGEYDRETRTVGALRRYADHGVDRAPGDTVSYVVVDDDARRADRRVRLGFESPTGYDADFYADLLVRAAGSVVAPLGWDRTDLRAALRETADVSLLAYE